MQIFGPVFTLLIIFYLFIYFETPVKRSVFLEVFVLYPTSEIFSS